MYFLAGREAPKTQIVYSRPPKVNGGFLRNFYAGAIDRLVNSFSGVNQTVDESLKVNLDKMRHRSRELLYDNDYGKKYIDMVKANIVGSKGIKLQAQSKGNDGNLDKIDNDAIEAAWKDFCKMENCSVTGRSSMLDIQHIAAGTTATDGEIFVRIVTGAKYKYGMTLQLIEADMLDTQHNVENFGNTKNNIKMGIEHNEFNVVIAYHFLTRHPSTTSYDHRGRKYVRVPADEIIHLFKPERVAQSRGIPWMHTSIRRLDMIGGYEEAELVAARAGASKMGFYYTETGEEYQGQDKEADGSLIQEAEAGTFEQLPNNIKFQEYDPQHPTGAYNYFLRGTLKGVAAGLGVAYTSLTGDLEAVNYSSIRAGLIEERENWRVLQGWFSEHMMNRIYERWLSAALTRGLIINAGGVKLPLHKKEKYLNVTWQTRGWAWVDPFKDEQANTLAVSKGHMTNTEILAARGLDIEDVYERLAYEKDLAEQYGLKLDTTEVVTDNEEDETTKD